MTAFLLNAMMMTKRDLRFIQYFDPQNLSQAENISNYRGEGRILAGWSDAKLPVSTKRVHICTLTNLTYV